MVTVLVCGGRNYNDKQKLYSVLDQMHDVGGPPYYMEITEIVNGAATGADKLSSDWARDRKKHNGTAIRLRECPADWNTYGISAGPIRNDHMLKTYKPEVVVAFPGGVGTHNMVSKAQAANVPVVEID
jgi:hypothetical protein